MNIRDKDMWVKEEDVPPISPEVFLDLLKTRYETALGFCELEKVKGFIQLGTDLGSSKGQEMLRLLMFKTIEEVAEAIQAADEDHQKEELIDALNFLLEARLLEVTSIDDPLFSTDGVPRIMYTAWITVHEYPASNYFYIPTKDDLGEIAYSLGLVGDRLRNRSWMHNPQDIYFTGRKALDSTLINVLLIIFQCFEDWTEFYQFFKAKDNVLRFRLRTKY